MKIHCTLPVLTLAALILVAPTRGDASGSYTARPPQPGAVGKADERAMYALGQRIYTEKLKLEESVPTRPEEQMKRLKVLQEKLPEKVALEKNLTLLAGKLTEEQLVALEFYVNKRHGK